jgi:hypothetical protein
MKLATLVSILFFLCLPVLCLASTPISVKLSLDRTEATMEDTIRMGIKVSGVRSSDSPPVIRGIKGFHVTQGGSSSRVEIINGTYRSGIDYTFFLTPSKTGTFQIGPAEILIDGKTYKSNSQKLHVRSQKTQGDAQPKTVFLSASLSKAKVFEDEQPIYTLRLYLRRHASNISLQLPELENVTFTQLEEARQYEGVHDGLQYHVIEIPYALVPSKEGRYVIDPARMSMTVSEPGRRSGRGLFDDPFFSNRLGSGNRPLSVTSKGLELMVDPLPLQDRPENFSGLVGDFKIGARIEPLRLKAGESATLTVTVEGRGNVDRIPSIKMPDLKQIKVYADEPALNREMNASGIRGSKTMKWALVPEKEGTYRIPSLSVPFFDTKKSRYNVMETRSFDLTVLAGKENRPTGIPLGELTRSGAPPVKQDVKELGHDILPLHDSLRSLGSMQGGQNGQRGFLFSSIILLLPAFFYGFTLVILRMKKMSIRSVPAQKAKKAAGKAIRECRLEGADGNCLIMAVRDYFNDRFGLEMAAVTPDDVTALLKAKGVHPDRTLKLSSLLKQLEGAVYTGQDQVRKPIGTEIAACIKQIEGEIR